MLLCFGTAVMVLSAGWRFSSPQPTKSLIVAAKLRMQGVSRDTNQLVGSIGKRWESTRTATTTSPQQKRLVVDLSDRRVYVYQDQKRLVSYPVSVGKQGWETPIGSFEVQQMNKDPIWRQPITGEVVAGKNNPLGDRWIGFWSDGRHAIGFHGTNQEQLVGQAVSHGCLRMRNRDIRTLYDQLRSGTPVLVRR